jgi:hypothetical protein
MPFSWPFRNYLLDPTALARRHTRAAVATLVRALSEERHAVRAAMALLDRGWGRSRIEVEELDEPLEGLGDAELEQAIEVLRRQVAGAEVQPQKAGGRHRRRRRRGRRRRGARASAPVDGSGIAGPR